MVSPFLMKENKHEKNVRQILKPGLWGEVVRGTQRSLRQVQAPPSPATAHRDTDNLIKGTRY